MTSLHALARIWIWAMVTPLAAAQQPEPATKRVVKTVNWPSFRGERACGVARGFTTPTEWDVEKGEHVLWKTPIPGLAHSSPVIWGERIFLTTAVGEGEALLKVGRYGSIQPVPDEGVQRFQVLCLDKKSGKILWTRTVFEGKPEFPRHPKGSFAASTPATDGARVVSYFGSEGLYCHDLQGELLWKKDLGSLEAGFFTYTKDSWGVASSPILHDGLVILQCDVQKSSFLAAFAAASGEQRWRTARDEVPTWSTPTVDTSAGREQVLVNGFKHIGGYALRTGEELWRLTGGGDIPVPTPVAGCGRVFLTNAHGRMAPIYAVSLEAEGEVTPKSESLAWIQERGGNYMQTPILYEDLLFLCGDSGILSCFDPLTGERKFRQRISESPTGFTASPVAAGGKLYIASEEGEVHVLRAGASPELLAVNAMGETCMATPAISEGTLFIRTRGHLYAIR